MFFISIKETRITLGSKEKCSVCNEKIDLKFNPMEEWNMKGPLCGDCYSKKLDEHYPGDHIRVNKENNSS